MLGASIANALFGRKGFDFIAGHCSHSGYPPSELYKADKYSWYLAPRWWLYSNTVIEPTLRMGYSRKEAVRLFQAQVRQNIESGAFQSTHRLFLRRCRPSHDEPMWIRVGCTESSELKERFGIAHTTFQLEAEACALPRKCVP